MHLSDQCIEQFKEIYKKEFGDDISEAAAEASAIRVLRFFDLILRPLPKTNDPVSPDGFDNQDEKDNMGKDPP